MLLTTPACALRRKRCLLGSIAAILMAAPTFAAAAVVPLSLRVTLTVYRGGGGDAGRPIVQDLEVDPHEMTMQDLRAELFRREVRMNENEEAEGNADADIAKMRTAYGERLYTQNLGLVAINQPDSVFPGDFQGAAGAVTIAHAFHLRGPQPLELTAILRDPLAELDSLCRSEVAFNAFAGLLAAALPKREPVPRGDLNEEQNDARRDEFLFREWGRQEITLPASRVETLMTVAHVVTDFLEIPNMLAGAGSRAEVFYPPEMYASSGTDEAHAEAERRAPPTEEVRERVRRMMLPGRGRADRRGRRRGTRRTPPRRTVPPGLAQAQIALLSETRSRHLQEVAAGEAVLSAQRYRAPPGRGKNGAYDWNSIYVVTAEPAPAHVKRAIGRCWRAAVDVGVEFLRSSEGRESAGRAADYTRQPGFMEQLEPVYRAEDRHIVDQRPLRARYQRYYYDHLQAQHADPGEAPAPDQPSTRFLRNPWVKGRIFRAREEERQDSMALDEVFSENPAPGSDDAIQNSFAEYLLNLREPHPQHLPDPAPTMRNVHAFARIQDALRNVLAGLRQRWGSLRTG